MYVFTEKMWKIIPKLFLLPLLIWSTDCDPQAVYYFVPDDSDVDNETEENLLKEDDKEVMMDSDEYKVGDNSTELWITS